MDKSQKEIKKRLKIDFAFKRESWKRRNIEWLKKDGKYFEMEMKREKLFSV